MRFAKRKARSLYSQASSATLREASWRAVMPFRISPKVRTLRYSRFSSVAATHALTFGSALGRTNSGLRWCRAEKRSQLEPAPGIWLPLEGDPHLGQPGLREALNQTLRLACASLEAFKLFRRQD